MACDYCALDFIARFDAGIAADQLWFQHVGNNLEVSIIGTSDKFTLSNWYTGSANHVGIGSDFDGGFGAESTPREIDTIRDLHKIGDALLERGYDPTHVTQIMHGNWLRVLGEALPN